MYRTSPRQAELDTQILRQRRIESRLLDAPETYTTLARRPGRVLLAGVGVGLIAVLVAGVLSLAGAARTPARPEQATVPATQGTAPVQSRVVTVVLNEQAAPCQDDPAELGARPIFAGTGFLKRIDVTGFAPGCAGTQLTAGVLAPDGSSLVSGSAPVGQDGVLSVDGLLRGRVPASRLDTIALTAGDR